MVIFMIHKPYEVETVTIPLNMPIAFENNALNSPSVEPSQTPPAPVQKVDKISPLPKPKVVHTVSTPSAKPTSEIVQTQQSPTTQSEQTALTESSAPQSTPVSQVAEAAPAPAPSAARPVDPNLKANFDIIRKRTFERLYYPQDAQNALKEGTATLIYKLTESGIVEEVILEHSTGYADLDAIVLKAGNVLKGERLHSVEKRINIRLSIEFAVTQRAA
jgi:TonB family protein